VISSPKGSSTVHGKHRRGGSTTVQNITHNNPPTANTPKSKI